MERKRSSRRYGRGYRERSLGEKVKEYLRQFVAFMFSNVGIIGLVVGYTIAGAFVFMAIEGGEARRTVSDVVRLRNETAARLWKLTCCDVNTFSRAAWAESVAVELLQYQERVVAAIRDGFDGADETQAGLQWSFPGAFLYSLTVITTIGYGNVAPKTEWGKMTTILYAIVGMPLFLLYLSNIGDILAKSFKWTYAKCCLCQGCGMSARRREALKMQRQGAAPPSVDSFGVREDWQTRGSRTLPSVIDVDTPVDPDQVSEETGSSTGSGSTRYDPQAVTVPVTLCLAIMVGYVCGGALLFSRWEAWDFLDGSYFCFISLSTIGFGDIVPGDALLEGGIELSFIFCSMYLMMGMALIAMCFNLMQEEVVAKLRAGVATVRAACKCRRRSEPAR